MRTRVIAGLFMLLLALGTAGCGGGSGGGAAGGTLLSGTASKGPIAGGTVKVYQIISSATLNPRVNIPRYATTPLAQGTTGADGSYSLTLPAGVQGSLMVQITGGSYTDEATGQSRSVDTEYGVDGMRAILTASGGTLSVSVTPYTEMAVEDAGEHPTDHDVAVSNGKIAAAFGLPDIVGTKPLDPNQGFPASGSDDAKKYALALATLSQYQNDFGAGATMGQIGTLLKGEVESGGLSADTSGKLGASSNNFASGSRNPNPVLGTPAGNVNAPASLVLSPAAPSSVAIGGSVTLTATLLKGDGTPVPDGTRVNFNTSLGTLSASSATTAGGLASVTLSSTVAGLAQASASSGGASGSAGAVTFFDPNAPAGIALSAGANQGIASGAPVLLSATVTRQGGSPVPDGTAVSFSIVSGSGTLSGATATVGGIATVNLSSSAAGSVTVRASAGGFSQQLTEPFVPQPTKAIVKVATTGSLPSGTLIGGIGATVTYAGGKGLSILPGNVVLSGVGTGSTLVPNANTPGQVTLGLINVTGLPLGEFATLTFDIAPGNFPSAADFSIAPGSSAIDVSTVTIPGVGASILGVTIQ